MHANHSAAKTALAISEIEAPQADETLVEPLWQPLLLHRTVEGFSPAFECARIVLPERFLVAPFQGERLGQRLKFAGAYHQTAGYNIGLDEIRAPRIGFGLFLAHDDILAGCPAPVYRQRLGAVKGGAL